MSEQSTQQMVDGPNRPFRDELLERLVGNWNVSGKMGRQAIQHACDVRWVLNHQFLQIHFLNVGPISPEEHEPNYEALVFIGYDNMSERYVVHWLDIFGGRFSETLGYGLRQGEDSIRFLFEGPTGPLHNTFTWHKDGTWSSEIVQKNEQGKWIEFLKETLRKSH